MSKVKIIETGEIKELSLICAKTGVDWSIDMIANHDGFEDFDNDNDLWTITKENYEWWSDLLQRYEIADNKVNDYRSEVDNCLDFEEIFNHHCGVDLDILPESMINAIDMHKSICKT